MSNRKITFINPPYDSIAKGYEFVKEITNNSPSLGLMYLAAEVREHGYEPEIIESNIMNLTIEGVVEWVVERAPAYVGITLFTVGVWNTAEIAKSIKEKLPETVIIIGGPHVSSMGRETMERFSQFDYAVTGEGEKTLMDLLRAIEGEGKLTEVPELIYRDGPFINQTQGRAINRDLDYLPMPAWDLLPDFPQAYKPAIYDYPRGPVATIAASRGCPFHCKFCDTSTFGDRVRYYSPAKVVEMMRHLKQTYGIRHVMFVDDLFLASRKRASEFCKILIEEGLNMTWSCTSRVDTVHEDVLALMKQAGCWEISFGLESGSQEMLEKMVKSAKVKDSERAVKMTAAAGIRTKGLFMLGYPGETVDSIEETKQFVRNIPMTIMNLTKFTPYPGSPIYYDLYGSNIRDDHWEKMNGMNFLWSPEGISIDELDKHYREMLVSFYRRPSISWHYTWLSLLYPQHMVRLIKFGAHFAKYKVTNLIRKPALENES
ncbi:MAG: B12-binding domain-containing radical SAM protein [Candidatus Thiodiazotropha weberae]|nr:B12-binding domain-containing radical SAM protein [Candidatus Thiodiazotropha lotti]ODB99326.1 cobalamin-binding protein [Candidatus Thiodiazotropha endoloripes]MCG8013557.1 B12-binding domain-containing radical SAM protein [Candidatus Thiodiazotropha lotti]MCG8020059.1 B12-binding domain-containing radical SAM protein [Candidatus Thiodiazotropha lotti]MCW4207221.1 B12-binding domain-containing radical SAM protein [Candidatus Thiodiazotropha lotti]